MNQFSTHSQDYLIRLAKCFTRDKEDLLELLARDIIKIWDSNRRLFICGNGGSAANSIHIANDLHYGLAAAVKKEKRIGMNVDALPANQAVITCLANDIGYENIFSHQLNVKASEEDLLVVLSGSGNSPNVVNALREGSRIGMKSYAILGFDGGICKDFADVPIHFPINDMLISEDIQMIVFNICFQWIVKFKNQNI